MKSLFFDLVMSNESVPALEACFALKGRGFKPRRKSLERMPTLAAEGTQDYIESPQHAAPRQTLRRCYSNGSGLAD
jgi:hypothetical protein